MARENEPQALIAAHLIEPEELAAKMPANPALAIVDMRGNVTTRRLDDGTYTGEYLDARKEYLQGHIPGAEYIDWTRDIVDLHDPVPAQVAPAAKIEELFGRLGIGNETLIVAYDAHPAMQFATRLWWVCRYYGCRNVRVLQGGWARWLEEKRPVDSERPTRKRATFTAVPDSAWIASAQDVVRSIGLPETTIVDARDEGQYTGEIIRGRRGGHVPGALNIPREALFESPGRLRPVSELREVFQKAGVEPAAETRVIAYCNGGVAATSVLFALSMLGAQRLANYDGSWNEWNLDDKLPVER